MSKKLVVRYPLLITAAPGCPAPEKASFQRSLLGWRLPTVKIKWFQWLTWCLPSGG